MLVDEVRREEAHEVERGAVGPVDVLDDVHDRVFAPEGTEEPEHRLEEAELVQRAQLGVTGLLRGQEPHEVRKGLQLAAGRGRAEAAQRLGERRERQGLTGDRDAGADEGLQAPVLEEFADQSRLAHARLTRDDDDPRTSSGCSP